MQNLKYSLKTHKFNKKRQNIFNRESEGQSISLQVHEPKPSLNNLIETSKYTNNSLMAPQTGRLSQNQSILQLPPTPQPHPLPHILKSKPSNHAIKTTKIPLQAYPLPVPSLPPFPQSPQELPQLHLLKAILYSNEERLNMMAEKVKQIQESTLSLYAQHQQSLISLLHHRLSPLLSPLLSLHKQTLLALEEGNTKIEGLEQRVGVLGNTLKDSVETLRVVKIKQDCIQALHKQLQMHKEKEFRISSEILKKDQGGVAKVLGKKIGSLDNGVNGKARARSHYNDAVNNFDLPKLTDLSQNSSTNSFSKMTSKDIQVSYIGSKQSIESFFSNSPIKFTQEHEQSKKSPFEANDLLLFSNTVPTFPVSETVFQSKQSEYSFRKKSYFQDEEKQPFYKPDFSKNEKAFKKTNDYETFRKPNLDNGYENFKKHILTSIGSSQVKAWLDNLHCLRRPNGSYILDHEGNPIICSPNNFAQLLKDKIVVQALEQ